MWGQQTTKGSFFHATKPGIPEARNKNKQGDQVVHLGDKRWSLRIGRVLRASSFNEWGRICPNFTEESSPSIPLLEPERLCDPVRKEHTLVSPSSRATATHHVTCDKSLSFTGFVFIYVK